LAFRRRFVGADAGAQPSLNGADIGSDLKTGRLNMPNFSGSFVGRASSQAMLAPNDVPITN
jgi:hypothetical protein